MIPHMNGLLVFIKMKQKQYLKKKKKKISNKKSPFNLHPLGVKNRKNLPTSYNGWSLSFIYSNNTSFE